MRRARSTGPDIVEYARPEDNPKHSDDQGYDEMALRDSARSGEHVSPQENAQ